MPLDAFRELVAIMARLRGPGGCPWDREQTMKDLGRYLREEADEVAKAIEGGDPAHVCEELGDLLFNLIHAARIAEEEGSFDIGKVIEGAREKIVRRHPHVFGDAKATTTEEVLAHWERVKAEEKRSRGK
jgi:tetrapyrrole methylase family protein / MazG family protein